MGNHIALAYLHQHPEIRPSEWENLYVYFKFKAYLQTTLRCTRKAYLIREGSAAQVLSYVEPQDLCRISDACPPSAGEDIPYDLEWAIEKLESPQAEVIRLYFYGGKTELEIARTRNVTRQAVNNLKRRALHTLKELLMSHA